MKNSMIVGGVALVLVGYAATAAAQSKTVEVNKMETITGTVEALDPGARQVTVKKEDGNYEVFTVPMTVKRFDTLKMGDRITTRHYENMVLRLQRPGEKAVDTSVRDVASPNVQGTGGTIAHQRTITATISAIDLKAPSVTFTGPRGFKYHTRVKDVDALSKVKVGDNVDITWTEAMIVSIEDAK